MYLGDQWLVVSYTSDGLVEIVEIPLAGSGAADVFLDGVRFTHRFMGELVADLAAKGYRYEPDDIGYRFEVGFALFSMGSRSAKDLDPSAPEDDPRIVCEGISIAPYDYFVDPSEEDVEAYTREMEAAMDADDSWMPESLRNLIRDTEQQLAEKPDSTS